MTVRERHIGLIAFVSAYALMAAVTPLGLVMCHEADGRVAVEQGVLASCGPVRTRDCSGAESHDEPHGPCLSSPEHCNACEDVAIIAMFNLGAGPRAVAVAIWGFHPSAMHDSASPATSGTVTGRYSPRTLDSSLAQSATTVLLL